MGKQVSPTLIGAFILGALGLTLAALALLGSGQFFKDTAQFVLFFPGTVEGLEVGAPVKFKGVTIGAVTDVRLAIEASQTSRLPVFIEIDNRKLRRRGGGDGRADPAAVRELVSIGLRAQLRTRSLLTGLLFVQLDLRPDEKPQFSLSPDSGYNEIPTIPAPFDQVQSAAERILARLDRTNIDELVDHATQAIDNVNRLVADPALRAAIESLPQAVASVNQAAASVNQLAENLDAKAGPLLESTRQAALAATQALQEARAALQNVESLSDPGGPLPLQIGIALGEFTQAAQSVRSLAEYLERNPDSVVRGRPEAAH